MQLCGVFVLSSRDKSGPEKAELPHRSTLEQQGKQLCLTPTGEMKLVLKLQAFQLCSSPNQALDRWV